MLLSSDIPDFEEISAGVTDEERLEAVRSVGHINADIRAAIGELSRQASELLQAPVALISLVEEDRDLIYGQSGLPRQIAEAGQIDAHPSFCQLTVAGNRVVSIEDAQTEPTLRLFPSVAKQGVRAHLGIPLRFHGEAIGNCCVLDFKPRRWSEQDVAILARLAGETMKLLQAEGSRKDTDSIPA